MYRQRDEPAGPVPVFAPARNDAATLAQLIEAEGMRAEVCAGAADFYARLEAAPLFAVITEEGVARCSLDALRGIARVQPAWSDTPLLVLADADHRRIDTNRFVRLAEIGNVTLVTRPAARHKLALALRSARRTRMLQFAVRDRLAELADQAGWLEAQVAERTRELEVETAERQRAEKRLAEARHLESLGQLTGGVAHDFNNLLQVVSGGESLLRMLLAGHANPQLLRTLQSIRRAADQGAALTRQLLAYARRQPLANVQIETGPHLRASAEMIVHTLVADQRLYSQLAPDLWPIWADLSQLDAALLNIATNARDAMAGDGRLVLAARNRGLPDPELPEAAHLAGDYVEISLTDDGHGMSEETARSAFEPFFTTKPVGEGTGLGLSQVYGFAVQSGGHAYIRRQERGVTVGILLPRSRQPAPAPAEDRGASPDAASELAGLRVLYVEDDPEVAEVTQAMLRSVGAQVEAVASADAAVHADFAQLDVVLSDVTMPGRLDGIGLARWLAQHHPHTPVVLTSGYMLEPARLHGLRTHFVRKPSALAELAGALARAASRSARG